MIAAYIRVSTEEQNEQMQLDAINDWRTAQGCEVTFYNDKASGKNLNRPALSRLIRDIQAGKVETVVVWALDRLSRNMLDGIQLTGQFCTLGVRVVVLTQAIDFSAGIAGQMMAAMLFGFAQMERERIMVRQRAGIESKRAKLKADGKPMWGGSAPGWVSKRVADVRETVLLLHSQGVNTSKIARQLDLTWRTANKIIKAQ